MAEPALDSGWAYSCILAGTHLYIAMKYICCMTTFQDFQYLIRDPCSLAFRQVAFLLQAKNTSACCLSFSSFSGKPYMRIVVNTITY